MSDEDHEDHEDQAVGLGRIADFCRLGVQRTGVDAITVVFASADAGPALVHATDEAAERVAELEFTVGEGPATDAMASGLPASADDLSGAVCGHRWPMFAAEASEAGIRAVQAYPISLDGVVLGCVGFHSARPAQFSSDEHRQAVAVTELIGLALVHPSSGFGIGTRLRMTVHQATGMVMVQTGLGVTDALVLLRSTAFTENVHVADLATDVLAGRRRFGKVGTNARE